MALDILRSLSQQRTKLGVSLVTTSATFTGITSTTAAAFLRGLLPAILIRDSYTRIDRVRILIYSITRLTIVKVYTARRGALYSSQRYFDNLVILVRSTLVILVPRLSPISTTPIIGISVFSSTSTKAVRSFIDTLYTASEINILI